MGNADERRSGRAIVMLKAAIESGGASVSVRVSNLSDHGALVVGDGLPRKDTEVVFRCHGVAVQSWIAWLDGERAGIQFSEAIQFEALAQKARIPPVPITRDLRTANFRRPGFRGNQLTPEERQIVEEWSKPQAKPSGNAKLPSQPPRKD